jgi:hypothetical protein
MSKVLSGTDGPIFFVGALYVNTMDAGILG